MLQKGEYKEKVEHNCKQECVVKGIWFCEKIGCPNYLQLCKWISLNMEKRK